MKVLGGDQFDSDVEDKDAKKPRELKAASKSKGKQDFSGTTVAITSRIGKLNLTKGSVAMFAVSEVHKGQYAIVSHTRNVKGFINLKEFPDVTLKVGQLVVCSVLTIGLGVNEKGKTSKKLQLSIDPQNLYRTLQVTKVTPGMFL